MSAPTKVCRGPCGLPKPVGDFRPYEETGKPRPDCRECERQGRKARRARNTAKLKEQAAPSAPQVHPLAPAPLSAEHLASVPPGVAAYLQHLQAQVDRLTRQAGAAPGLEPAQVVAPALPVDPPALEAANDNPDGAAVEPDPEEEKARRLEAERLRREASDYEALKPGDFSAGVGRGAADPNADREKKQEYARQMGAVAEMLRDPAGTPPEEQAKLGAYVARLAEEERRFMNRRPARTVSLAVARDALERRLFIQAAEQYLKDKIVPVGYAQKRPERFAKRTVVGLLSDLHLGSELRARDNPNPFMAVEEARCLEHVVRQIADFKPQYRAISELVLLLNGDLIEGKLGHDMYAGAPLTEQKFIFYNLMGAAVGFLASAFPSVRIICQPGNHGRDKGNRHPGRATESKWDGLEWEMCLALKMMSSSLQNVTWDIPFHAVATVPLYESKLLLTHGDTEVKLGDPDTKAVQNAQTINTINATNLYGHQYQVLAAGHFHKPRYQPHKNVRLIFNGALVPENGYARSEGYINEPCGQYIWEAVEGYPVGDLRFIEVGKAQSKDERLGSIIKPFRFDLAAA
jgi:hypothetical protein